MRLPFIFQHPAHFIATGAGSGLSPIAPGTAGTLFAGVLYYYAAQQWGESILGLIFVGLVGLGYWSIHQIHKSPYVHELGYDNGAFVIDEIAAFWGVLWLVSPDSANTWGWAFFWFRLFDMLKPWGIRTFERRHLNAHGVMGDDLIAGFYVLLLFALWRWL